MDCDDPYDLPDVLADNQSSQDKSEPRYDGTYQHVDAPAKSRDHRTSNYESGCSCHTRQSGIFFIVATAALTAIRNFIYVIGNR